MPNDRTAVDTITGYYYQFDYYILQLLNGSNNHEVCIEAIEDVDIRTATETTAVQCKYYAKTEYNHSVIAKPIRLMLSHFQQNVATRDTINYKLYGYFEQGQSKLNYPITIDFLKEKFLTYTTYKPQKTVHIYYDELGLSDEELTQFLIHLTIDINAMEFDEQRRQILRKLKERFSCNDFEAEYYYYNNALRVVRDLSTKQSINQRTTTTQSFLSQINHKSALFDVWFLQFKGERDYCKAIKEEYFSRLNVSPCERFFLIDCDQITSESDLKSIILKIQRNWSKLSIREPKPFCPYIYLHAISEQALINLKRALQRDNIYFIDGYDFKGAEFNVKSLQRKPCHQNGIKLKFINNLDQIDAIFDGISSPYTIFEFFLNESYYSNDVHETHLIRIPNTNCISKII